MKKFVTLLFTLFFCTTVAAIPLRFEEGKHYEVVGQIASAQPNVTEYFSFYCPHCFRFETIAKNIEDSLPKNIAFKKNHVDFLRHASPEVQNSLTRAMIVGEAIGLKHPIIDAIFNQLHVEKKPFTNEADLRALFIAKGADGEKFDKLINSFAVKGAASQMKKAQDDWSSRQVLTSVPMLIVNDKYKIIATELRSLDDYTSLIKFLVSLK